MSLGFLKWPLRSSFRGSAEQEAPSEITTNHVWLDILAEHPPTPDEPVTEFAHYFQNLEEAVRARSYVPVSPAGRVRPSAPLYTLNDDDVAAKTEAIFRQVFEHEGWKAEGKNTIWQAWKTVPHSLMKLSFKHEDGMYTPATIFRTAEAKLPYRSAAQSRDNVIRLDEHRHAASPTPPDGGGTAALVADAH